MIAYVRGQVQVIGESVLVLTQGGVGYRVWVGPKLLSQAVVAEKTGAIMALFTHAYIREDRFELYGVATAGERQLFGLLVNVSGCGPKTALAIAEAGSVAMVAAVQAADVGFFTSFPRVGKKLAQKLIIDLKTKLGGLQDLDLAPKSAAYTDALEALTTLGFSEGQIRAALAEIAVEEMSTGEVVKAALKKINK
jgi:Holliday junction DNA helicase RuvA